MKDLSWKKFFVDLIDDLTWTKQNSNVWNRNNHFFWLVDVDPISRYPSLQNFVVVVVVAIFEKMRSQFFFYLAYLISFPPPLTHSSLGVFSSGMYDFTAYVLVWFARILNGLLTSTFQIIILRIKIGFGGLDYLLQHSYPWSKLFILEFRRK
jgi:hypothetical protein